MTFTDQSKIVTNNECGKCDGGCCKFNRNIVFISFHEIKKIRDLTGLPIKFFAVYGATNPSFRKQFESLPDSKRLLNGNKSVFLRSVDNQCVFLTAKGCSLPHDAKTVVCRAFPLWYSKIKGKNKIYFPEGLDTCSLAAKHKDDKFFTPLINEMQETNHSMHQLFKRYEKETKVFQRYKHYLDDNSIRTIVEWLDYKGII